MGEAGTAGQYYRLNATTGYLEKGNGTTAPELGNVAGILLDTESLVGIADTIVLLDSGAIIDLGEALVGKAFNTPIYIGDTDATLSDTAGTVSRVVGRVVPGFAHTTPDLLLQLRST